MSVICLSEARTRRQLSALLSQPVDSLLHGPITAKVAEALELLTDAELEAFFIARAKAKIQVSLSYPKLP